ncbi:MAG: hypothetical protein QNL65_01305 [Opitutales bacterium]|jgi:hypothetical protein|tara:strand:+ start:2892 stop:4154 length:1263 start_codon:yes stop_codon:yes gene_type:complete
MAEPPEKSSELPVGELREITLRIPGEHFFCDTISLPASLKADKYQDFAEFVLNEGGLSPYPVEQLAWGYQVDESHRKFFIFATPLAKLRQLGWQNFEIFRRVFPSFISLLGNEYPEPTIALLLFEETLTAASFQEDSSVPDLLYSIALDQEEGDESIEVARGKLLSLFDLEKYEIVKDILVANEVERTKDGFFRFEHDWLEGKDSDLALDQDILLSADELWTCDLRQREFIEVEQKRRNQARARWKGILIWSVGMAAMLLAFAGIKIMGVKLEDRKLLSKKYAEEVPLVIESQKLLEKLRQNKLGGIDPFGALIRVAVHRGGSADNPSLWFSLAHFQSRNEVKLEGEGKTIEAINTFIKSLEKNNVANIRVGRSGEQLREIKSGGGKTTFEIEIKIVEEGDTKAAQILGESSNQLLHKNG